LESTSFLIEKISIALFLSYYSHSRDRLYNLFDVGLGYLFESPAEKVIEENSQRLINNPESVRLLQHYQIMRLGIGSQRKLKVVLLD